MPETIEPTEDAQGVGHQPLVRLIECGRRSCGYILTSDERDFVPDAYSPISKRAICPKCGEDGFYTLNENGQQITMADRDKYRDGVAIDSIEPTKRMGLKRKRRILAAKRRAIEANATSQPPGAGD